jgi:Zn-finger nucleic acid-binding protein
MNCPKCGEAFENVAVGGIEVQRCTGCKAIWFDAREHEKLKRIKGAEKIDVGEKPRDASEPHRIDCPVCHTRMITMTVRGNAKLKYESCTVCYGAFFDAGEFREYHGEGVVPFLKGLVGMS